MSQEQENQEREYIPFQEVFEKWMQNPDFRAAYDALEDEFALGSAIMKARADADMTQEEVALAMGTSQALIARLEGGKTLPSTRTLQKFAKATHTKLRISFEPEHPGHGVQR
jgi:ribosome-binding protein aMBF1 (putative translation factor)